MNNLPRTNSRELPFAAPVMGHRSTIAPTRCLVCGELRPTTAENFVLDENLIAKAPCCLECVRTDRKRRDAKHNEAVKDTIKRLLTRHKLGQLSMPDEQAICSKMFEKFGGLDRFCDDWKTQIDAAVKARPGSKNVLDQFMGMFKMATAVGDRVQQNVGSLTDQQLQEELDDMAMVLFDRIREQTALESEITDVEARLLEQEPDDDPA